MPRPWLNACAYAQCRAPIPEGRQELVGGSAGWSGERVGANAFPEVCLSERRGGGRGWNAWGTGACCVSWGGVLVGA